MATYSAEQVKKLQQDAERVGSELELLVQDGVSHAQRIADEEIRSHLKHGASRRLNILSESVRRIFFLFPPQQERPLPRQVLVEAQIYLHAFVINLSGVFDNWAWAFILRHGLREQVGDRTNIGMFRKPTQRLLPSLLSDYLTSESIVTWHRKYLTGYRDSLAHRIPLYIPPATWTLEDSQLYERLDAEIADCIRQQQFEHLDDLRNQQDAIGTASPVFVGAFSGEDASKPVFLHSQVIADATTVAEFGRRYYSAWHQPPPGVGRS
jgi:hypothetical protein